MLLPKPGRAWQPGERTAWRRAARALSFRRGPVISDEAAQARLHAVVYLKGSLADWLRLGTGPMSLWSLALHVRTDPVQLNCRGLHRSTIHPASSLVRLQREGGRWPTKWPIPGNDQLAVEAGASIGAVTTAYPILIDHVKRHKTWWHGVFGKSCAPRCLAVRNEVTGRHRITGATASYAKTLLAPR